MRPSQQHDEELRLIAFLSAPESYEHGPDEVRLLQTHASFVAIAPPFVFKVKKPVNFGFLDFSTLERRLHFCREEVRLNRRLCARIYEGVVPIFPANGGYSFADTGVEPVEFAVKMKLLPEDGFLDERIRQDSVDPEAIDRIAARLHAFYSAQAPGEDVRSWGTVDKIAISIDENFDQTREFRGNQIPEIVFDHLRYYNDNFLSTKHELLDSRLADGRVLDCHGDLRAEHIHFSDDDICIYDCIEFNERLRFIDVANDLAFLAMDLHCLGRQDLARTLVDEMSERLADDHLRQMVGFYGSYRAYVRGKVEAMKSVEAEVPAPDREASSERARRYFQLSLDYSVTGGAPSVVVIMGGVGTGKSTLAERTADVLGWEVVSSDRTRKELLGLPLHERASQTHPEAYNDKTTDKVYRTLAETAVANAASPAGRSTVIDATFSSRTQRDRLRNTLIEHRIAGLFVEATASTDVILERLRQRSTATDVISDARESDYSFLSERYEMPDADERDVTAISTDSGSVDDAVAALLKVLTRRWNP